jgi:urease accessory protein UreF
VNFEVRNAHDGSDFKNMPEEVQPAIAAADASVDVRALTEQLGSAEELTTLSPTACSHYLTKIHSLPSLREFLIQYSEKTLGPNELPSIYTAYQCATQNFSRELLALDKQMAAEFASHDFELASRHVGKRQLNRLRALKDLRLVQRYREAVNEGKAHGWHTLVYGIVLCTYSIPLRQGLLHYGRQTLGGFIESAARTLDLRAEACLELQVEMNTLLRPMIEKTIALNGASLKLLS